MAERPLILVSNDDGVHSKGIAALAGALAEIADVVTVAPEREHSAGSHAITLSRPLRHRVLRENVHGIDGTPVDCVYIGIHHDGLLPRRPDLVCSGINHGPNLGFDVYYSGTVAAAREGTLRGVPAMAFSMVGPGDMDAAGAIARDLVARMLEVKPPADHPVLLNVNFPAVPPRGVRPTRLGQRHYVEGVVVRKDPRGREYFWIGGPGDVNHVPLEGSDTDAIDAGYVSVTPLRIQATHPDHFGVAAYVAGAPAEDA